MFMIIAKILKYRHILLPVPRKTFDFQRHMLWSFCFIFNCLRCDVVVPFMLTFTT